MKIEWLNQERTLARLTRGLLTRRVACVIRKSWDVWSFIATDEDTSSALRRRLERARDHALELDQEDRRRRSDECNWEVSPSPIVAWLTHPARTRLPLARIARRR